MNGTAYPRCSVPWEQFGLGGPAEDLEETCSSCAGYRISQVCSRGHASSALVCEHHLSYIRSLLPLSDWHCQACLDAYCYRMIAPVTVCGISGSAAGDPAS